MTNHAQPCLLIEQSSRAIDSHRRAYGWALERIIEGSVRLECLDFEVSLETLYEDFTLPDRRPYNTGGHGHWFRADAVAGSATDLVAQGCAPFCLQAR